MRRARAAGLAAPAVLLIVAAVRAEVHQEPFLETTEGTSINITCSHPKIQPNDWIQWYRQVPCQAPVLLAAAARGSKPLSDIAGSLLVSSDRSSSWLWLAEPRRGDAAVYYCALGARAEEPGLRPGTNRRGRGRNRHRHQNRHRHRHRQWDRQQHRQWTLLPITNGTGIDTTIDTGTVIDPSGASRGNLSNIQKNKCHDLSALQVLQADNT
ncbi:LOW QUALITY PROTEIN: uncharacterized protein LOC131568716 [Ammospiza caudacuta]|uniref:LOW QUALITY PROTEIN: uncharacterized protein LOC131568716 n=1 Tax=Ammospiza caudacuta TaxID=2857398 RepID=UPI00273A217C|nr:LOW QUALITY PROTEIN: uncharacterized protein LOC131568716 [Ammospiza caudacuta]